MSKKARRRRKASRGHAGREIAETLGDAAEVGLLFTFGGLLLVFVVPVTFLTLYSLYSWIGGDGISFLFLLVIVLLYIRQLIVSYRNKIKLQSKHTEATDSSSDGNDPPPHR